MPATSNSRYPVTRTARKAVQTLAGGSPEVILLVPGWLSSAESRRPICWQVRQATRTLRTGAMHTRWAWLRETADGRQETAFRIWPCLTAHGPGFQCRDGRLTRGSMRFSGRALIPKAES